MKLVDDPCRALTLLATLALVGSSCSSGSSSGDTAAGDQPEVENEQTETGDIESDGPVPLTGTLADSEFYGEYEIVDEEFGTDVKVTLTDDSRIVQTNALPPWEASEFPVGNNTDISEQDIEYTIPLVPEFTGAQTSSRVIGVSVAGIKFDAGTAQRASCENGVEYRVEAVNSLIPFGLDENNAHVQNDGTYHYHNVPVAEIEGDEPEFIGFAFDGHMIYYSPSGQYKSSYTLKTDDREGENCTYSEPDLEEITFENTPDGTFAEDWEFIEGSGDLDACNGAEINGEYAYFITDEYPIIPRCLNGEAPADAPGGGGPDGGGPGGPPEEGGPDGGGGRPQTGPPEEGAPAEDG